MLPILTNYTEIIRQVYGKLLYQNCLGRFYNRNMLFFSRWMYYLKSIPTLLLGFRNWPTVVMAFLKFPMASPFIVELRSGLKFQVRGAMDIWVMKETCLDRDYEVYGRPIQDGWTILDIGAALGDFAIWAAHNHPTSHIHAIEPFPESYALMQANQALNKVGNLSTYPYAIGKADEELRLNLQSGEAVMFSTSEAIQADSQTVTVQALSLDHLFDLLDLPHCDFLKMDCEGGEYDILMGASPTTLQKIKHICLEYHDHLTPYTHTDLTQFLESQGFTVRRSHNPAHQEIGFLYAMRNT